MFEGSMMLAAMPGEQPSRLIFTYSRSGLAGLGLQVCGSAFPTDSVRCLHAVSGTTKAGTPSVVSAADKSQLRRIIQKEPRLHIDRFGRDGTQQEAPPPPAQRIDDARMAGR
jgi:hypothetical protein